MIGPDEMLLEVPMDPQFNNPDPKPNPTTYAFTTIAEMTAALTWDNLEGFIKDFRITVAHMLAYKDLDPSCRMETLNWIDDWKTKE